jgi:hypothetical protein
MHLSSRVDFHREHMRCLPGERNRGESTARARFKHDLAFESVCNVVGNADVETHSVGIFISAIVSPEFGSYPLHVHLSVAPRAV